MIDVSSYSLDWCNIGEEGMTSLGAAAGHFSNLRMIKYVTHVHVQVKGSTICDYFTMSKQWERFSMGSSMPHLQSSNIT